MSTGRCAGCGKTGPERPLRAHIAVCSKWLEVFTRDPKAALDPVREYSRWLEHDRPAERVARRIAITEFNNATRAAHVARFARGSDIDLATVDIADDVDLRQLSGYGGGV